MAKKKATASNGASAASNSRSTAHSYSCFTCDAPFPDLAQLERHAPSCREMPVKSRSKSTVSHLPGFVPATSLTKARMRLKEAAVPSSSSTTMSDNPQIHLNGQQGAASSSVEKGKGKQKALDIPGTSANASQAAHPGLGIHQASVSSSSSNGLSSFARNGAPMTRTISAQSTSTTQSEASRGQTGVMTSSSYTSSSNGNLSRNAKRKARKEKAAAAQTVSQALEIPGAKNGRSPSPGNTPSSAASSTDELPFTARLPTSNNGNKRPSTSASSAGSYNSPKARPTGLPSPGSVKSPLPAASPSAATPGNIKASPFSGPFVNPFDFLAARSPFASAAAAAAKTGGQANGSHSRTESVASTQSGSTVKAKNPNPYLAHLKVQPPTPERVASTSSRKTAQTVATEDPESPALVPPQLPAQQSAPQRPLPPPLISQTSGKRVPQSPLLWSSGASPKPLDAPTFGSPLLPADDLETEEQIYEKQILKASTAVGRDAILAALKERTNLERAARGEPEKLERVRRAKPTTTESGKSAEKVEEEQAAKDELEKKRAELQRAKDGLPEVEQTEEANDSGALETGSSSSSISADGDGVKREDMLNTESSAQHPAASYPNFQLYPAAQGGYNARTWHTAAHPGLAPSVVQQMNSIQAARQARMMGASAQQAAYQLQDQPGDIDTAAVQGVLPTLHNNDQSTTDTATTTVEEEETEESETDSDASVTSHLLRGAVKSTGMAQGWEDPSYTIDPFSKAHHARCVLEQAILELNRRHMPSNVTLQKRRDLMYAVRKKLNGLLPEWRPDFQYQIAAFGSTAYGLDTDTSDLDLCIIDPKRPDGFRSAWDLYDVSPETHAGGEGGGATSTEEGEASHQQQNWAIDRKTELGLDTIYEVRRLAGVLRRMGCKDVVPIPSAGVPIVKFKSPDGIKADMVRSTPLDRSVNVS